MIMNIAKITPDTLTQALEGVNYLPDENLVITLFLALQMKKPILVEGPPGTGKTELAKAASRALGREFFRVQCYEGITFEQIVGEWNYQKQLLQLEISRQNSGEEDIFKDDFFIKRPLLQAFINSQPSVILLDEIDKADEEVESFLLQALGEKEITVNDLGTFQLTNDLLVVLTSNSQRTLLDETRDRCLYLHLDYPNPERELEIVKALVPEAPLPLIREVVRLIQRIRGMDILKKPSIRATVDWVRSLMTLGEEEPERGVLSKTLGVVVKSQEDRKKVEGHLFKLEGRLYDDF
jgi:MoxR-like ATPase